MHVEEVLPDKFIQYCTTGDTEAALYGEILEVLLRDVREAGKCQEWVGGVEDVWNCAGLGSGC